MTATKILACPHCHSKNRVPVDRLAAGANCGRCKQPLFTGQPITLTTAHFDNHIMGDMPVVVDFWASWCGPCKQFAPVFAQGAQLLEPNVQLAKVDTDAEPALSQRFSIRSIPTLMMFRQGEEIARVSGALPSGQFVQWVRQHL